MSPGTHARPGGQVAHAVQGGALRRTDLREPLADRLLVGRRPREDRRMLRGISEIRAFFRTNETPIHFVSPTAFNLLRIDRRLRNFS